MSRPRAPRGAQILVGILALAAIGLTVRAATTDYILADPSRVHISLTVVSMIVAPIALLLIMSGMRAMNDWGVRQKAATSALAD